MPDIDPAALSRPTINASTPLLATKSLSSIGTNAQKAAKSSQIPARIDLEPLYGELKAAVGLERWQVYKEATAEFFIGGLSQDEFSERIDPVLVGQNGEGDHLHNQIMAAVYGNVSREMPDQGLALWVSSNDKPAASTAKAVTGDAAERKLKGEVMLLPARDRRRIKDLTHNDIDFNENLASIFTETRRKPTSSSEAPASAGINNMSMADDVVMYKMENANCIQDVDLEIRKRFAQPLAIESGEFPDVALIGGRMLPFCYEAGLSSGHVSEAPQLMSVATEAFIKEMLTQVFARTRSNGPGDSGNAGYGVGTQWVQTHNYKRQLRLEEEAAHRGELGRDKAGLLPVEARAAGDQGPLSMADVRVSVELADSGMSQFPVIMRQILCGYREGELENWDDHTWIQCHEPDGLDELMNGYDSAALTNGTDAMDIDTDMCWDGAEDMDMDMLDNVIDSCLAVGS